MEFSKDFLEQLANDLSDVADALDDDDQTARARLFERVVAILRTL